jgi:hypothetical protein
MTRCRSCGRRLRRPSPDGYGPVCRRAMQPPRTASGSGNTRAPTTRASTGQLALDLDTSESATTHTQEPQP